MQDLNDLYYFAQVVKYGGFAPAGRALAIPKSKLSRRISLLEENLGLRLIHRSTRSFSVTETGELYLKHCQSMLIEAEAAQEAIEFLRSEPRGKVKLSCPVELLQADVRHMLPKFMNKFPNINLQVDSTNRRVDLVAEGIDVAIRVRPPPLEDSDLVLKILAQRPWAMVASPTLFVEQAAPKNEAELATFPSLDRQPSSQQMNPNHTWRLAPQGKASNTIKHSPKLITDSMLSLEAAAVAGIGIVELPKIIVNRALKTGELIQLLPDWQCECDIVHVVYPSRRGQIPAVRALIDFLAEEFFELNNL